MEEFEKLKKCVSELQVIRDARAHIDTLTDTDKYELYQFLYQMEELIIDAIQECIKDNPTYSDDRNRISVIVVEHNETDPLTVDVVVEHTAPELWSFFIVNVDAENNITITDDHIDQQKPTE